MRCRENSAGTILCFYSSEVGKGCLRRRSEPEIPPVVLLDQTEVFKHDLSHLLAWHVEHFFVDQLITDGSGLRGSIIHQILLQGHKGVGVTAVLDLSALAEGHEAVTGAAFPVTCGTEAGDVIHLHEPADHLVKGTVVADVELLGAFVLGFWLVVSAHAGAGSPADLGDTKVQRSFPQFLPSRWR